MSRGSAARCSRASSLSAAACPFWRRVMTKSRFASSALCSAIVAIFAVFLHAQPAAAQCENVDCDDFNACTNDSCDPQVGCIYESISCDDQNVCTDDSCDAQV